MTQPCTLSGVTISSQTLSGVRPTTRTAVSAGKLTRMLPALPGIERTCRLPASADTRASLAAWAVPLRLGSGLAAWPSSGVTLGNRSGVPVATANGLGVTVQASGSVG